jgi:hypothetical protein
MTGTKLFRRFLIEEAGREERLKNKEIFLD